ncbi:putative non-LTR retroelement reverse transcriptase, partial [Trifolium medium]|nr:putative non-LTR retroelement reverse transcriptase [Trifolium medium]
MNLSLLSKWRRRLLQNHDTGLWKEVLVAKYGIHIVHEVVWSNFVSPAYASLWWKDIRDLEMDKWLGDSPLSVQFPRLYSLSLHKFATVMEMKVASFGNIREWNLRWRRNLFQWEEEEVSHLVVLLDNVVLSIEEDSWRWVLDPEGCFSVKSSFVMFSREMVEGINLSFLETSIFRKIWKSPAPSKVVVFSWQLLHNRDPTKDNLISRGVIQQGIGCNCVWCGEVQESANHLSLHCKVVLGV